MAKRGSRITRASGMTCGEPDAVRVARPVRRAGRRNPPTERWTGRSGPTLHEAAWPEEVDLLLPLRAARPLQSLRRGLDAGGPRERQPGGSLDRGDVPQARSEARDLDPSLRPWISDDGQVHRPAALRPRRDAVAQPPSRLGRQPVLRGAIQDAEVPPGLPGALRGPGGCDPATAARSSRGTTTSTATGASPCSRPPTSISAGPPRS
jgi:hypothetical protein